MPYTSFQPHVVNHNYVNVWKGDRLVGEAWREDIDHDWSVRFKTNGGEGDMIEIGTVNRNLAENVQRHLIFAMLREVY